MTATTMALPATTQPANTTVRYRAPVRHDHRSRSDLAST